MPRNCPYCREPIFFARPYLVWGCDMDFCPETHGNSEMQDSDTARQARDLRTMLDRTVGEADRLISPVLERLGGAYLYPDATPPDRYALFLEATDCISEERESGAHLFFGFLCHAYALHGRMGAMPDDELLDAAGRALESILTTPDDDVPSWLMEEEDVALSPLPMRDGDVAAVPELLRRAFDAALGFAVDWCETRVFLEGADNETLQGLLSGDHDHQWFLRVKAAISSASA